MTKFYRMDDLVVHSNLQPSLIGMPVAFHAVNKSGSLVAARMLQSAYAKQGRETDYLCRYFNIPASKEEALDAIKNDNVNQKLLIDHGLVGVETIKPNAKVITMLRHPIRRIMSVYYWLLKHHPEKVLGRDILNWIRLEGIHYTQIRQFAFNHLSSKERGAIPNKSIAQIAQLAGEYFENHIAWFGVTELYDESMITLHWELGLDFIAQPTSDDRNTLQPKYQTKPITNGEFDWTYTTMSKKYYTEIEELLGYDIVFYELMKNKFQRYLKNFELGTLE